MKLGGEENHLDLAHRVGPRPVAGRGVDGVAIRRRTLRRAVVGAEDQEREHVAIGDRVR